VCSGTALAICCLLFAALSQCNLRNAFSSYGFSVHTGTEYSGKCAYDDDDTRTCVAEINVSHKVEHLAEDDFIAMI